MALRHNLKMDKLAEKYFNDHNTLQVKCESFETKLYTGHLSEAQVLKGARCVADMKHFLEFSRIERRSSRSVAVWLPEEKMLKVTRLHGTIISTLGLQNKNGKFLRLEEGLFLLETNRLEIQYNGSPLSIQEAFKILVPSKADLCKYLAYKKLVLQGCKVEVCTTGHTGQPPTKKIKLNNISKVAEGSSCDIFNRLQDDGPQEYKTGVKPNADFVVHSSHKSKMGVQTIDLDVMDGKWFESKLIDNNESKVYAINVADSVSFYKQVNFSINPP